MYSIYILGSILIYAPKSGLGRVGSHGQMRLSGGAGIVRESGMRE